MPLNWWSVIPFKEIGTLIIRTVYSYIHLDSPCMCRFTYLTFSRKTAAFYYYTVSLRSTRSNAQRYIVHSAESFVPINTEIISRRFPPKTALSISLQQLRATQVVVIFKSPKSELMPRVCAALFYHCLKGEWIPVAVCCTKQTEGIHPRGLHPGWRKALYTLSRCHILPPVEKPNLLHSTHETNGVEKTDSSYIYLFVSFFFFLCLFIRSPFVWILTFILFLFHIFPPVPSVLWNPITKWQYNCIAE